MFLGVVEAKIVSRPQRGKLKERLSDAKDVIRRNGTHEPIIPVELFEQVQDRLRRMRRRTPPVRGGGGMLFTGLLRCGACGSRMTGRLNRDKRIYIYFGYLNRDKHACNCNSIDEEGLAKGILTKMKEGCEPSL